MPTVGRFVQVALQTTSGEQRARVDHVVAGEAERVAEREQPLVVLVLAVRHEDERVERLVAELVAVDRRRVAAVPEAVLRRVAVEDERRVGPPRTPVGTSVTVSSAPVRGVSAGAGQRQHGAR